MIKLRSPRMTSIPVIGLHTPQQTAALQQSTGMLVSISRTGARLVSRKDFTGLLDDYELADRQSYLSTLGAFEGDAA